MWTTASAMLHSLNIRMLRTQVMYICCARQHVFATRGNTLFAHNIYVKHAKARDTFFCFVLVFLTALLCALQYVLVRASVRFCARFDTFLVHCSAPYSAQLIAPFLCTLTLHAGVVERQTRWLQVPVGATPWRFKSSHPHQTQAPKTIHWQNNPFAIFFTTGLGNNKLVIFACESTHMDARECAKCTAHQNAPCTHTLHPIF